MARQPLLTPVLYSHRCWSQGDSAATGTGLSGIVCRLSLPIEPFAYINICAPCITTAAKSVFVQPTQLHNLLIV